MNHYGGGAPEPKHSSPVPCPPKHKAEKSIEDYKRELNRIGEKYADSRKKSWSEESERSLLEERLHMEIAIERILEIIGDGEFTVDESEEILAVARKRINISTPVRVTGRYLRSLSKESVQSSHQDIP